MAVRYHPDKHSDNALRDLAEEKFKEVRWAYEQLVEGSEQWAGPLAEPQGQAHEAPRADALVDRETFYRAACAAMEAAVRGLTDPRAVAHAQREAAFATLERFGLAERHVGRRPRVRPGPRACSALRPGVECPRAQA